MKTIKIKSRGGLDNLQIMEQANPQPIAGEILVRWHTTSLNYHDCWVATGGTTSFSADEETNQMELLN